MGSKFPKFPGNYVTKSNECNINHYKKGSGVFWKRVVKWSVTLVQGGEK